MEPCQGKKTPLETLYARALPKSTESTSPPMHPHIHWPPSPPWSEKKSAVCLLVGPENPKWKISRKNNNLSQERWDLSPPSCQGRHTRPSVMTLPVTSQSLTSAGTNPPPFMSHSIHSQSKLVVLPACYSCSEAGPG